MKPPAPAARRLSMSSALVLGLFAMAMLVGALSAWQFAAWSREDLRTRTLKDLADTARGIGHEVSTALAERQSDVHVLRDLLEAEPADRSPEARRLLLERVRAGNRHLSWLGVVARDGLVQVATGGLLEGVSVAGRDWFEGALGRGAFIGDLHPARLLEPHLRNPDGAPLRLLDIALTLRGGPDRQVVGVLGCHVNWRMVEEIVSGVRATPLGGRALDAAVVAADGTILFDTRGGAGNVREVLATLPPRTLGETAWPGSTGPISLLQMPLLGAAAGDGLDWRLVVYEPASTLHEGLSAMTWRVLGTSAAIGLLLGVLGARVARGVWRR